MFILAVDYFPSMFPGVLADWNDISTFTGSNCTVAVIKLFVYLLLIHNVYKLFALLGFGVLLILWCKPLNLGIK